MRANTGVVTLCSAIADTSLRTPVGQQSDIGQRVKELSNKNKTRTAEIEKAVANVKSENNTSSEEYKILREVTYTVISYAGDSRSQGTWTAQTTHNPYADKIPQYIFDTEQQQYEKNSTTDSSASSNLTVYAVQQEKKDKEIDRIAKTTRALGTNFFYIEPCGKVEKAIRQGGWVSALSMIRYDSVTMFAG